MIWSRIIIVATELTIVSESLRWTELEELYVILPICSIIYIYNIYIIKRKIKYLIDL